MWKLILANIIWLFHILVVLFVLFAPFSNRSHLLILHIVFSISLLVHWHFNDNTCSLTLLEGYLRNKPSNSTFTHSFISPIYNVSSTSWDKLCYSLVIVLMLISMYKLRIHPIFQTCADMIVSKSDNAYKKCFVTLLGGIELENKKLE